MPGRPARPLIVLALVTALLAAGCLAKTTTDPASTSNSALGASAPPSPKVDAKETLAKLREFAEGHPYRNSNNDMHNAARDWLAKEYGAMGLTVVREELTAPPSPTATPTGQLTGGRLVNVCGILWGASKTDWIVVGGHYDVTDGAVYGEYDDGSGTILTLMLAKAFAAEAKNATPARTTVFCGFDGEEQGLRGSAKMAEGISKGNWSGYQPNVTAMMDIDMAGIAWPAESPLVIEIESHDLSNLTKTIVDVEKYPKGTVEYRGISGGRSDGASFIKLAIPTVFFISAFDKVAMQGQTLPSSQKYPFWHQLDTYEGMIAVAGSEENLVQGFQHVANVQSHILAKLLYDATFKPDFADKPVP